MKKYFSSPAGYLSLGLFLIGTFMHLSPFLTAQRTLYSISEDGYLMMTIARNIAIGLGMSTADGTLPTNGTQPLMTFIMTLIYSITGGDKIIAIKIIIVMEWLISFLGALIIYKIGKNILDGRSYAKEISLLTAMIWYSSPNTFIHTMNALETGLYGLVVIAASGYFVINKDKYDYLYFLKTGIIFGVLFWLRNDAIFFVLAAAVVLYLYNKDSDSKIAGKVIFSLLVGGLISLPWVIYNYVKFKSLMPISGQAEMINSQFGGNLIVFPSVIIEYLSLIIPIPYIVHMNIPFFVLCLLVITVIIVMIKRKWAEINLTGRKMIVFYGISLCMFYLFYGPFFETYYFVPRYLFPFSAFFIALPLIWLFNFKNIIQSRLFVFAQAVFFVIMIILAYTRYNESNVHMQFYLVDWIEKNVKQDEWVGAFQSGTIGYFHDRTINLDGKVNFDALEALKENKIYQYIADRKPEYLINWQNSSEIEQFEPIKNNYNLIVNDSANNISVFKRK